MKGDFGPGAKLRPLHFTISIVLNAAEDGYAANTSTGLVAEVVSGQDGRMLLPGRNFEIDLDPAEQAAADTLVSRLLQSAVEEEGLAGVYIPAPAEAAAAG